MIDLIGKLNGIIQILALVLILIRAFLVVRELTKSMTGVFFMFAIITRLASDLYYWIHVAMNKGGYLPFSAMDLAAMGMFFLYGAAAHSLFPDRTNEPGETAVSVCAALFAAANVFLWGYYSGAWFQDIFSGVTFVYLCTTSAQAAYRTGAIARDKWFILGGICAAFIAVNILVPILKAGNSGMQILSTVLDMSGYSLMFGTFLWLSVKTFRCIRRRERDRALALSFVMLCWAMCTLYMCAEPFYELALSCETFQIILMWFIIERRVKTA